MNKLFKHNLYTLTAAVTLGAFSLGFAPAASAIAMYDANASLSLTLTDVITGNGTHWSIEAEGDDFGGPLLYQFGDAEAFGSTSVVVPVAMSIGDTIKQTSSSYGNATDGYSWTDALTDLNMDILVKNISQQELTFIFDYSITAIAEASGEEASAYAGVGIWNDLDLDILAEAEVEFAGLDNASQVGFFEFTLQSTDVNGQCKGQGQGCDYTISAFVDTSGEAEAYADVPEPAITWLFGIGLLGLLGVTRSRRSV